MNDIEGMSGNLVYLATPYTRHPRGPYEAFIEACQITARLLRAGLKVYSPIAHTHCVAIHGNIDPLDLSIWLPFDEAMMIAADVLVVAHMDGWQESKGVGHEIQFFEDSRKPIFDLDPVTLTLARRRPMKPVRDRIDDLPLDSVERERRTFLGHAEPGSKS